MELFVEYLFLIDFIIAEFIQEIIDITVDIFACAVNVLEGTRTYIDIVFQSLDLSCKLFRILVIIKRLVQLLGITSPYGILGYFVSYSRADRKADKYCQNIAYYCK